MIQAGVVGFGHGWTCRGRWIKIFRNRCEVERVSVSVPGFLQVKPAGGGCQIPLSLMKPATLGNGWIYTEVRENKTLLRATGSGAAAASESGTPSSSLILPPSAALVWAGLKLKKSSLPLLLLRESEGGGSRAATMCADSLYWWVERVC